MHGHELADNTIIDIHATLHRAMEIAVNNHLIPKNPTKATVKPKKKKKDLQVLNDAELDILMQAIDADSECGDFFYLELTTGLRRGEICGLRWRDFDEKEGVIRIKTSISMLKGGVIYEGEPKRKILLPKITADRLRKRKQISEWIFPNLLNPKLPIAPPAAYRKAKRFLRKLNLPNISFHDLRHTFATTSVANGIDIKTLSTILGHVSSKTTLDIYLHSTEEMKKEAAEKINARFNKDTSGNVGTITDEQEKPPQAKFEPKKGKMRKPGTGCISKINDHIYEGRYSPKDAYGKRMARNIYAPTREECEEKLAILIKEMNAEIAEQKAKLKNAQ